MPFIDVTLVEGRTPEQLRAFVSALTEAAVTTVGAPRDSVRVGSSGVGREGGNFSREFFTEPKAIIMQIGQRSA